MSSVLVDPVSPELKQVLRTLKLGTLPERPSDLRNVPGPARPSIGCSTRCPLRQRQAPSKRSWLGLIIPRTASGLTESRCSDPCRDL